MQVIRKIDDYFIGSGVGTVSDRIYFFGLYLTTGAITAATLFSL